MQFKLLAALALAASAGAQDLNKYFSDISAYYSSLLQDPQFASVAQGLLTADPSIISSLQALQTQTDLAQLTAGPPALITALPSPYNQVFGSVYSKELAIASSDGIISNGQIVGGASGQISSLVSSIQGSASSAVSAASTGLSGMSGNMTMAGSSGGMASATGAMPTGGSGSGGSSGGSGGSSGGSSSGGSGGSGGSGSSGTSSSSSKAGAAHAHATGVAAMGVVAGAIGGLAVLL